MECRRFCRSICRRRLNYIRCVKHCPISFDVDQNIAAFACICVLNTPILYKKDFTFIFSQCKIKPSKFCVCIKLERRGKRGRNKQTEKHEVCKGYKICFCVFLNNINSHSVVFTFRLTMRHEKCMKSVIAFNFKEML